MSMYESCRLLMLARSCFVLRLEMRVAGVQSWGREGIVKVEKGRGQGGVRRQGDRVRV